MVRPFAPLRALYRRNPILAGIASLHVALFVVFVAGIALDPRTVGAEPVWLKPAKFAGSLALFAATLGWLTAHLPLADRTLKRVSYGIAAGAVVEIALVGGQAARGVESHFNDATALDAAVYDAMGAVILGTMLLVTVLAGAAWSRELEVEPAFAWGIRLGLGVFLLGSLEGAAMVAAGASAVGSGPTLPVAGWAAGGDFRVAHFVGLHGLQVLPLAGHLAARRRAAPRRSVGFVVAVAAVQVGVLVVTFAHALGALGV